MALLPLALAALMQGPSSSPEAMVDKFVADFMASEQVPGVAVAIVLKGDAIFQKGYGVTDLERKAKFTPQTPFPIASLSKPVVAMAILRLAEDGKLNLNDAIGKYLPDLPESWKYIPLIHLLDHTAGIPDHVNSGKFKWPKAEAPVSGDDVYKMVTSMPVLFEAGLQYSYSNGGYVLLARVIENVTKHPYGEYLRSVIFNPLGMRDTYVMSQADVAKIPKGFARGKEGPELLPAINTGFLYGNGQILSTLADLVRWDAGLYTDIVLDPATLKFITTDQALNSGKPVGYAMGWVLGKDRGSPVITHDGKFQGYRSYFSRFAAYDLSIIILANNDTCDLTRLGRRLVNILVPSVGIRILTPIPDDYPDLTQHHLDLMRAIVAGTINPDWLSPAVQADFLPQKAAKMGADLKVNGDITGFDPLERTQIKSNQFLSRYRLRQGKVELIISLWFDANGVITSLRYESP